MADDWSPEEVAAIVADYFAMLSQELRGEPFSKREHNRRLQAILRGRSAGSIEFKHANISAVLIELGFPYINGYKPRRNYQDVMREAVVARLDADRELEHVVEAIVDTAIAATPPVSGADIFVPPPLREPMERVSDRRVMPGSQPQRVNYLEREARNRSLGAAGETFVLAVEHRRLWEAGQRRLAERIDPVSRTVGDGLGYDILSFEADGRARHIEVKTTHFGPMTPFFVSVREVEASDALAETFYLYRVFGFRHAPRIFTLHGSLRQTVRLDPVQYRASLP